MSHVVAAAVLGGCLVGLPQGATQPPVTDAGPVATLTVRGEAMLDKPADRLRLAIGVVTEAEEAREALDENSRRMKEVVTAVKRVGLSEKEYETRRFSIQPRYARRPQRAGPDWQPRIIGYHVSNTILIKTTKMKLAGELIEAANRAGANSIDSISFDLANPRTHRAEAIATATVNCKSDAAILARSAGVRLVRVLSISLDEAAQRPPLPIMQGRIAMAAEAVSARPPIQSGDVTVRASVTIVYEIGPADR